MALGVELGRRARARSRRAASRSIDTWRADAAISAQCSPHLVAQAHRRASAACSILDGVSDGRRALEALLEGLNEPQREAVTARRGAAADPRRRGLGQDARAHPPDRPPGRHRQARSRARSSRSPSPTRPRRRCASASSSSSAPRARDVGDDLPLGLRADAALRRRAARLHARLHDLRRGRLGAAGQACIEELDVDPKRFTPRGDQAPDLRRQEPAARRRGLPRARSAPSSSRPPPTSTSSTSSGSTR